MLKGLINAAKMDTTMLTKENVSRVLMIKTCYSSIIKVSKFQKQFFFVLISTKNDRNSNLISALRI